MLMKFLVPCFVFAASVAIGCGSSSPSTTGTAGKGGTGGAGGGTAGAAGGTAGAAGDHDGGAGAAAGRDGGTDTATDGGTPDTADASTTLSGCVDKVTHATSGAIVNQPNGVCDTYGSFTLKASAAGAPAATNLTLFRTDATGLNLMASGGHFARGVWTTQTGAQNIPGNYVAHLFVSKVPNPTPADFVALTGALSLALTAGDNEFYFFADKDDTAGGDYGFGLNVWLGNAAAASPTLSGFAAAPGGTVMADGTTGCSPAYDGTCGVSANTLTTTSNPTVTLTSFTVAGVGGAAAPADAGASD